MDTSTTKPVSFPTSSTPPAGGSADYRDSTVARAAMQAHDAVDRVAGSVGPVVDRVKDVASKATNLFGLRDVHIDELQEQTVVALRIAVRKRPVAAVAIAVGVGWILGRAFSR